MVRGKTLEGRITRLKASGAHGSKTVPGRTTANSPKYPSQGMPAAQATGSNTHGITHRAGSSDALFLPGGGGGRHQSLILGRSVWLIMAV